LALYGIGALAQSQPDESASAYTVDARVRYYLYRTYSWQRMAGLGVDSALDHLVFDPHAWDRGADGFACRYSSSFGGRVVRNSIELGTGILFHEDTRFRESRERTFFARLRFATAGAVLAYGPEGERRFAFSRLAATTGGILICSTWRPRRNLYGKLAGNIADSYFSHWQNSMLTEFSPDMVRFGKRVRLKVLGK
jgi:hypothetical protein